MLPRLRLLAGYLLFWLGFFVLIRAVFLLAFPGRAAELSIATLLGTFGHGFRLDLSAAAYLSFPAFLLVAAVAGQSGIVARRLLLGYTGLAITGLALIAAADLGVFAGWGQRIDASVLPYLAHPREAWASAGAVPRWPLLLLWLLLSALGIAVASWLVRPFGRLPALSPHRGIPLAASAALLFLPARGGWQLIPINQSSAYFSPHRFANQAALNAPWNFFDSWLRGLNRTDNPYVVMPMDSVRTLLAATRPAAPGTASRDTSLFRVDRPNILLIIWESLPARAVEPLGGLGGVTPELNALVREGLLFRRFYAAGDHTEKGVAALLAGAPTVPHTSILRVLGKAAGLPMLPRTLGEQAGYQTSFYYGGEVAFGNLVSFATEARFSRIIGKEAFDRSAWTSKWGVHDGTVADALLTELRTARAPFFTTWLTLSSHEPFEVPGPAKLPGSDPESRFLSSLAYTDQVIGSLVRRAREEPWWANTLVIIVADHGKLLAHTDAAAPYKSAGSWYHIPMLWLGGALNRRGVVDRIGGQTDLAPTLLARLGLPGSERYAFGRDLFDPEGRPLAFYGFDEGFGLVTEKGSFVWERGPKRVTSHVGALDPADLRLGQALLQLAYQDYLDR